MLSALQVLLLVACYQKGFVFKALWKLLLPMASFWRCSLEGLEEVLSEGDLEACYGKGFVCKAPWKLLLAMASFWLGSLEKH